MKLELKLAADSKCLIDKEEGQKVWLITEKTVAVYRPYQASLQSRDNYDAYWSGWFSAPLTTKGEMRQIAMQEVNFLLDDC